LDQPVVTGDRFQVEQKKVFMAALSSKCEDLWLLRPKAYDTVTNLCILGRKQEGYEGAVKRFLQAQERKNVLYAGNFGKSFGIPSRFCYRSLNTLVESVEKLANMRKKEILSDVIILADYMPSGGSWERLWHNTRHYDLMFIFMGNYPRHPMILSNLDGMLVMRKEIESATNWWLDEVHKNRWPDCEVHVIRGDQDLEQWSSEIEAKRQQKMKDIKRYSGLPFVDDEKKFGFIIHNSYYNPMKLDSDFYSDEEDEGNEDEEEGDESEESTDDEEEGSQQWVEAQNKGKKRRLDQVSGKS
jgi:hypothetical protein